MNSSTGYRMKSWEWLLLILLSMVMGGAFFFSKVALAELRPFTVVLGRVGMAAILLNLLVRASGQKMPTSRQQWGRFLIMGLLNNLIPFSLIFYGQTQIPSSLASILNATIPLWLVVLAHFLTRDERLTTNRLGGVVFGLVGIVVMIGPDALAGLGLNVMAQLAVLGAAASYALAAIFGKRFKGTPPLITATGQVTCTALIMLPIVLLVDRPWTVALPGFQTWGALIGLAVISTTLSYIIYFRLLASIGATNLSLVAYLIPISALLLGVIILGEQIAPRHLLGMGVISLGLMTTDGRLFAFIKQRWPKRTMAINLENEPV